VRKHTLPACFPVSRVALLVDVDICCRALATRRRRQEGFRERRENEPSHYVVRRPVRHVHLGCIHTRAHMRGGRSRTWWSPRQRRTFLMHFAPSALRTHFRRHAFDKTSARRDRACTRRVHPRPPLSELVCRAVGCGPGLAGLGRQTDREVVETRQRGLQRMVGTGSATSCPPMRA